MTTIFSDDFESGNLNAWTTEVNGATISIQASPTLNNSSYACRIAGIDAQSDYACAYRAISGNPTTLYMRAYIKFSADLNTDTALESLLYHDNGTYNIGASLQRQSNGTYRWKAYSTYQSNPQSYYSSTFALDLEKWYCVEIQGTINSSTGQIRLWIDGTQMISQTLNTGSTAFNSCFIEAWNMEANTNAGSIYFDDVIVADSYIGPETRTLTIQSGTGGTTTPSAGTTSQTAETYVDITPTAESEFTFEHWILDGNNAGTANPYHLLMNRNHTIQPVFTSSGGSITADPPLQLLNGVLSLNPFAHTYVNDWNTATIGGSQVSGNINGNAASITGTIPHTKITDWDSATSSFVTSGTPVSFSSVVASGSISAAVNSLDDGLGNAHVRRLFIHSHPDEEDTFYTTAKGDAIIGLVNNPGKILNGSLLSDFVINNRAYQNNTTQPYTPGRIILSTDPQYSRQDVIIDGSGIITLPGGTAEYPVGRLECKQYMQAFSYNDFMSYMSNDGAAVPTTGALIRISNLNTGGDFTELYTIVVTEPYRAPMLMCRHHLAVKKDAYIKGQIGSVEGGIILHGGNYAPGWYSNKGTNNPMIQLGQADIYGNNATLEIRTDIGGTWGYGNIAAGLIQGAANGEGDAFLIGNDAYLTDINWANGFCVKGKYNSDVGGVAFGATSKVNLANNGPILYFDNVSGTGGFLPYRNDVFTLGSSDKLWHNIYGDWIHAWGGFGSSNKSIGSFDALPDIEIIKKVKSTKGTLRKRAKNQETGAETIDEIERDIIDFEASGLGFLTTVEENVSINNSIGFLFGVCKALALKIDDLERKLKN